MINRSDWLRFNRWYQPLHPLQKWTIKIGVGLLLLLGVLIVTHEPSERPRQTKIIKNCDICGVDPERSISYNEYQDRKEQQQRTRFAGEKQRLRQEIWDEKGRARWCKNHPEDRNCKNDQTVKR